MATIQKVLTGNEAVARGLVENGCTIATSYPGTPASEILSSVAFWQKECAVSMHVQWAVNEKIAFEISYTGSISGLRTAVSMKQVGLNVASDPLMSAAYMGTIGGFLVISADDPGPHSSQTEQDSRLKAMMAKVPVLDPDTPQQAKDMVKIAYELSEVFEIPVMLRPTTRVCHVRQNITMEDIISLDRKAEFQKAPDRWAATPKFRNILHKKHEEKLDSISSYQHTAPVRLNENTHGPKAIVVSGVAAAHTKEIMKELNLWDGIPLYQVLQPYPVHSEFILHMVENYDEILILEETEPVIEMQFADRDRVKGKLSRHVPKVGELLPETIQEIVHEFAGFKHERMIYPSFRGRRPTLCPGCPHRASFFAIKKAVPKGLYPSDIGCYTLGLNLGAVDTVLCMGAAISQATGFYHAYKHEKKRPDIVATIGDSTFFHAGIPALIDTVVQKVPFVLVILDNGTTAMTGYQPTPATGYGACGEPLEPIDMKALVSGCGVQYCREGDPYELDEFISLIEDAVQFSRDHGPAVVIARHACLNDRRQKKQERHVQIEVTDACNGCGYCITHFECPALILDEEKKHVSIDRIQCNGCGVCIKVCPNNAIREKQ